MKASIKQCKSLHDIGIISMIQIEKLGQLNYGSWMIYINQRFTLNLKKTMKKNYKYIYIINISIL